MPVPLPVPFVVDVSQLTDLFRDFLAVFDRQMTYQRTFFSNPFTRVRFFEPFLRSYVALASPGGGGGSEWCAWAMTEIQARDVPLDHRIWAVYAKSKVDAGEPGFLLRVFELLERESPYPLDFSPRALNNWSMEGVRWKEDDGQQQQGDGWDTRFTLPRKVLSAYVYGLRQLLNVRAYVEALALHSRIVRAGYREGTNIGLDRLVYRMMEDLRLIMRHGSRLRASKSGIALEKDVLKDEEGVR